MPTGSNAFKHLPLIEFGEFLGVIENPQFSLESTTLITYAKSYAFQEYLMEFNWEGMQCSIFCAEHPVRQWHQCLNLGAPSFKNYREHQRARQAHACYISGIQNNSSKTLVMYVYSKCTVFVGKLFRQQMKTLIHAACIHDKLENAVWINIISWQEELELYHSCT